MLELRQTEWCPASRRLRQVDANVAEPAGAEAHRLEAAKARRRYLEEECECLLPATR